MKNSSFGCIVIGIVVVILCSVCLAAAVIMGGAFYLLKEPRVIHLQDGSVPRDTLNTLQDTNVPINDQRDLAARLLGITDVPATMTPPPAPFSIGARQKFWVLNSDSNTSFQIDATLKYITNHLYFWVEDGIAVNDDDMAQLMEAFEQQIYPTDRKFFGSEWSPGIDGDPHLYIVYANNLGGTVAGAYSPWDELPPQVRKYSNAHEMFVVEGTQNLADQYTYGILAHEFQHMIHWNIDRNEESWVNEGFSELAVFLNGYNIGFKDYSYISDPDLQLNDWNPNSGENFPHYGSSFLFMTYFLDRFGANATQAVVADPNNGMSSIDDVLAQLSINDPVTGKLVQADDVFGDWVVANYLKDGSVGDGRYVYHNYENSPQAGDTESFTNCPQSPETRTVHQYGVDYISFRCGGSPTLKFLGSTRVGVVPENAHSGTYMLWSNKGDESDMILTQTFDFTSNNGPLTLKYWTWYDLEKDYDYLYLESSLDGKSWKILNTPSCTDEDPAGSSYGCGYNGLSDDGPSWIEETVDLSEFAGKKVQLRFEYITDPAVNGEGLLLDDIAIPEIDYQTDLEKDSGGWEGAGFVRIENVLPQTYRLSLIRKGQTTTVETIELTPDQTATVPLNFNEGMSEAVLVVSGTTRFTRQETSYQFSIEP